MQAQPAVAPAALGARPHSGWAMLVGVAGSRAAPELLDRKRIQLTDGSVPAQPFHAAAEEGLDVEDAMELIRRVEERVVECAVAGLGAALRSVEADGCAVAGVGVVARERAIPDNLAHVLRSHQLLHASEGELYEEALCEAATRLGVEVARVDPSVISVSPAVAGLGRSVGPPWQMDHKLAAEAAFKLLG